MRIFVWAGLSAIALGVAAEAVAQDKPAPVVAYRQNIMKSFGGHSGAIKLALTETPAYRDQVADNANAIASLAGSIPTMFPADADNTGSWALPVIWEKPDAFNEAAERAQSLAQKLADAAAGNDDAAVLAAFSELGQEGCGGCHKEFRKKE